MNYKYPTKFKLYNRFQFKEKEIAIKRAWEYMRNNRMFGDWLEFGSYSGNTLTTAMFFRKEFKCKNRIVSFDSFEGFIEKDKFFGKGEYASTISEIQNVISRNNLGYEQIGFVKIDFKKLNEKIKTKNQIEEISGVYIDCDRYELCIPILEFIKDNLEDGAVILFDDWFLYKGYGVRKAFLEFCKKNKKMEFESFGEFGMGKGFIFLGNENKNEEK